MSRDAVWSVAFSIAIAVLMLSILLIRTEPVATWVLVVYPGVGAALAHIASRTSPTLEEIAWIETGTIAAACIVVLAGLVNMLLIDLLVREMWLGEILDASIVRKLGFFALPTISVLLWWSLERRLSHLRLAGHETRNTLGAMAGQTPDAQALAAQTRPVRPRPAQTRQEAAPVPVFETAVEPEPVPDGYISPAPLAPVAEDDDRGDEIYAA